LSCLSALSASPPRRPRFQSCPAFRRRIPGRSPRGSRERFTALPHRPTVDLLRESSYAMPRNAAPGNIMVRGRFRDRLRPGHAVMPPVRIRAGTGRQ